MFNRILVALDGSKLAESAKPYAEQIAKLFDSELVLLSVNDPAEVEYSHMHELYVQRMADLLRESVKNSAATVKAETLAGKPASEIINYARDNDVSLIIMASHGRTGVMGWAMGSVATRVVENTAMPVLLVKAATPSADKTAAELFARILIPLDGSETAEATLPHVRELNSRLPAELTLLQVIAPGKPVHTLGGLDQVRFTEHLLDSMKAKASSYLETVGERVCGSQACSRRYEVRVGEAADQIVRCATDTGAGLVAISHHGESGIGHMFMGRVAHKVLHACRTPILLVKTPGKEA